MDRPNPDLDHVEEIYVNNAGLVILWPVLAPFFEHLALTDKGRFVDLAARQRAIALLHTVATGEDTALEYQVPLNKVLCGLPLSDILDFHPLISAEESEACEDLLTAVIRQAPILGEMAPEGLRNAFLLRAGILRSRDGEWQVKVERKNYDIVLDRFPWSWKYVRLPWMDIALRVEW